MPYAAKKICSYAGCSALTNAGRCKAHKIQYGWLDNNIRGSSSQRGYGAKWRKVRMVVLNRDNHLCISCNRLGLIVAATDVDHIVPKSLGGRDNVDNLQSLCKNCHKAKTLAENK